MKKIILLSDGTGNGAAKRNKTNVWRLYRALDLHRKDQIAKYDDGVGSQQFLLFKLLGGAFGIGLKRNVVELYKFLCRNYEACDAEGMPDQIYLFGFSRGAFTVRVLAGLIETCGLFTAYDSERDLHEKACYNYSVYRSKFNKRQLFVLFAPKRAREDAHTDLESPKIEFVGVWDTVDAYGLPVDELAVLWDRLLYPMRFRDRRLSDEVAKACHAISIDDERHTFHPVLWSEREEKDRDRIEQVWFAGVHSDVGGGYPRDELSLVSLDWMISKVESSGNNLSGLRFRADLRKEYWRRSDWHGTQHDSRAGLAAYYRYKPRHIESLCNSTGCGGTGVKITVPKIHCSVFERIRGKVVPYAPTGLPENYEIVSTRDQILPIESDKNKKPRADAMNRALDIIYWRRWLYAAFLLLTATLGSSQFFLHWDIGASCAHDACLSDPTLRVVADFLPDFLSGWIEALRQNGWWLLAFAVLFSVLGVLKRQTSAATLNRAMAAWSATKVSSPPSDWSPTITSKLREFFVHGAGRKIRWLWWALILALILSVIGLAADRMLFRVRDSLGWLCLASDATDLTADPALIDFDTGNPCLGTEVALVAGRTYRFDVQTLQAWFDGELPAGPAGLEDRPSLAMRVSTPLRRHRSRPWFELIGRVGQSSGEFFPIGSGTCYTARSNGPLFLYVNDAVVGFLPGPYWAFPYGWSNGPNSGTATITVTPAAPSSPC